jgi:hypothetical protein
MMKAVRAYETSVHSNETKRLYIPEASKLFFYLGIFLTTEVFPQPFRFS